MKREKVYSVEFIEYCNAARETVYSKLNDKYLDIDKEPFLVKESDIDKYSHYGKGYRGLTFVGYMEVDD